MLTRVIIAFSLLPILLAIVSTGCSSQVPASTHQSDLTPVIFSAEEIPWEEMQDGLRRKVLFSGELTLAIFEVEGPRSDPFQLHSHVHDQITYIMEGDVEVQVGDETKRISTGGFFRVPSNTPHRVHILSPKVLAIDAFTPPREDYRKQ